MLPVFQIVPYARFEELVRDTEDQKVAGHVNTILAQHLDEMGENSSVVMMLFEDGTWECAGYTDKVGNVRWLEGAQNLLAIQVSPGRSPAAYTGFASPTTVLGRSPR